MTSNQQHGKPPRLLTPADVAELLQISEKTVYKNKRRLCGFYPAGIKVLRFREDVIYGIMEGRPPGAVMPQFSISGPTLRQGGKAEKRGGNSRRRRKEADENRHGLFDKILTQH